MKVMISQPMNGKTQLEIIQIRDDIREKFSKMHIDVIDTIFKEEAPKNCNVPIYYLAKSIDAMKDADALYMCDGWKEARGCQIEHEIAMKYGIKILYSDFFNNKPLINTRVFKEEL